MKKHILILASAAFLFGATVLHSQTAAAGKNPLQVLQSIKASNADLIDKQKKTLDALDELQKNAEQLKIMGKRT